VDRLVGGKAVEVDDEFCALRNRDDFKGRRDRSAARRRIGLCGGLRAVVVTFMGVAWQSSKRDDHAERDETRSHVNFLRG
jgi:hypothetical protein